MSKVTSKATARTATPKAKTQKEQSDKKLSKAETQALRLPRMPRETFEEKQKRFYKVLAILRKLYPGAKCALDFNNAYELVVATILSAQCTDVRVNIVMKDFRKRYPTVEDLAEATLPELEKIIHSAGFYKQKAKSLKSMASDVVEKFGKRIPKTMEELTTLKGVGRKTANVVMGNAFNNAVGIAVDTHVTRVAARLGFTKHTTPEEIEEDLMKLAKQEDYVDTSHLIILHGRSICEARKPKCSECEVSELCPSYGMKGSDINP